MKFFLPKRKRMVRTSRSLPNVSSITLREIGEIEIFSNFFPPRALQWDQPVPGVSLFRWTEDVFALVWLASVFRGAHLVKQSIGYRADTSGYLSGKRES